MAARRALPSRYGRRMASFGLTVAGAGCRRDQGIREANCPGASGLRHSLCCPIGWIPEAVDPRFRSMVGIGMAGLTMNEDRVKRGEAAEQHDDAIADGAYRLTLDD